MLEIKLVAQAITTVVVFVVTYLGVDLDPEVSGAIAVLIGAAIGWAVPSNRVKSE